MKYCHTCGKEIEDTCIYCPNCGADQRKPAGQQPNYARADQTMHRAADAMKRHNLLAMLGLALSALSLSGNVLFAVGGLILCLLGKHQIKTSGEKGGNLANIGILVSSITLVFYVGIFGFVWLAALGM